MAETSLCASFEKNWQAVGKSPIRNILKFPLFSAEFFGACVLGTRTAICSSFHPEESLAAFSDPAGTPDGANASEATWDTPYHYAWYRQPKSPIRTPVVIQGKPRLLVHGHTPLPPDACITQQAINVDVGYGIKSAVEIKGRQFRRWFVKTDEIIGNLDHPVS